MTTCTIATGKPNNVGYASTWYAGVRMGAHVAAYLRANDLPLEVRHTIVVMHACDNKLCINPAHLSAGTHKANSDDKIAKGRARYRVGTGELNPNCILRDVDVQYIRANFVKGAHYTDANSAVSLAARFGVSRNLILKVYNGHIRTKGTTQWLTAAV